MISACATEQGSVSMHCLHHRQRVRLTCMWSSTDCLHHVTFSAWSISSLIVFPHLQPLSLELNKEKRSFSMQCHYVVHRIPRNGLAPNYSLQLDARVLKRGCVCRSAVMSKMEYSVLSIQLQPAQSVGNVILGAVCVAFITNSIEFNGVRMRIIHLQYGTLHQWNAAPFKAEPGFLNLNPVKTNTSV